MAFQPANFVLGLPGTVYGAIATVPTPAVITSDGGGATADVGVDTGETVVTTVTADGTGTEAFSIVGGAEAGMFTINPASGALAFITASVDGEYTVIVKATNDWGSDTQTITVTVPSPEYHADAVHWDGATRLDIASLTGVADSATISFSYWAKESGVDGKAVWLFDPASDTVPCGWFPTPDDYQVFMYERYIGFRDFLVDASIVYPDGNWHHILFSTNTNFSAGNKIAKLYIDDVDRTGALTDAHAAFLNSIATLPFRLVGTGYVADMADFWWTAETLLTAGDIPEATRRKFISADGKPVDLGADGSTPTGTAPPVFFSGDAAGFVTNRGTGGVFTLTGVLTNAGTSPSD